jgi:transposase
MQVKTVLNRVHKVKGFVYEKVRFSGDTIEIDVRPRRRSRAYCAGCGRRRPSYDRLPVRRFAFVPLWGINVFLTYAMRRVDCPTCGVTVESVPWAEGKERVTIAYALFLARWARRLSWKETAQIFRTSWDTVFRCVGRIVAYGLAHRPLDNVEAIGVDEVQFQRGHKYLTLVYQIDTACRRLLWIGPDRTARTLLRFFRMLGKERTSRIRFVCSDMWRPYLKVIAKKVGQALHILDRYHLVARLNKAVDEVRAEEHKWLKREGYEPILTHSRWCFLKRPENLTGKQKVKLDELLGVNLRTVRAYLLKESFQGLWQFVRADYAGLYLDGWIGRAMRSRLEPIKKVAKSLRLHRELILNWFEARGAYSAGIVEGFNNKVKLTIRKAYGYKQLRAAEVALYHALGQLPEPKLTHEFC